MKLKWITDTFGIITTTELALGVYSPDRKVGLLFDSGYHHESGQLLELLKKEGLRIDLVVNTHNHLDHVGANLVLRHHHASKIMMPRYEAMQIESLSGLKSLYYNVPPERIKEGFGYMIQTPDDYIEKGQKSFFWKGEEFQILHNRGHSLQHCSYKTPDGYWYLGDMLITKRTRKTARIPYAYILSEDIHSKRELLALEGEGYLCTHKGLVDPEDLQDLVEENIAFYQGRAEELYHLLKDGMTEEEIRNALFRSLGIRLKDMYHYHTLTILLRSYMDYYQDSGLLLPYLELGELRYRKP